MTVLQNLFVAYCVLNATMPSTFTEAFSAEQAARLMAETPRIRGVQISPDGSWVIYVVHRKSVTTNLETTEVLLQHVPQSGASVPAPIRLPDNASVIRWRPDGQSLSMFISSDSAGANPTRTFIRYDIGNGKTTPIPLRDPSVTAGSPGDRPRVTSVGADYQWAPRGAHLAFTAPLRAVGGVDPRRGVPSILATSKTRNGLFVLDVTTGIVTQATPDSLHVSSYSWAPDEGSLVAAVRSDPVGFGPDFRTDLVVVERASGAVRQLVTQPGIDASPSWSPDGRWIAFVTHDGEPSYNGCWPAVTPATGGPITSFRSRETPMTRAVGWWAPDSRAFYYTSGLEMTPRLVRADVTTRATKPLPAPKGELPYDDNYSLSADGRWMAYTRESLTMPAELFVVMLDSDGRPAGEPRRLTDLTPNFPLTSLVRIEALSWPSQDGKFTIHGLLLTPASARSGGRVTAPLPTLLYYYGGPSMVRRGFAAEGFNGALLALAARGYAVLVPNTRGRGGYGEAFERGIRDGKSNARLPYEDAMAGIDLLIKRGLADSTKLGVLGHSYGGFLTEYTITQTQRFKGAVVHEGHVVEMVNSRYLLFELGSDNELLARDLYGVHNPFDPAERARLLAESPGFNADRITTPTLLQFGAKSGVAESVGQKFFNALRRFKAPSAFFIYDEGHVFQRPAAIADDLTRTAEWLDYWVRGIPFPDAERAREYNEWRAQASALK